MDKSFKLTKLIKLVQYGNSFGILEKITLLQSYKCSSF